MNTTSCDFKISLKACRVNANLKQKELADKLGVSDATIKNWEKGETSPKSAQLQMISEITGIPMNFIFLPTVLQK